MTFMMILVRTSCCTHDYRMYFMLRCRVNGDLQVVFRCVLLIAISSLLRRINIIVKDYRLLFRLLYHHLVLVLGVILVLLILWFEVFISRSYDSLFFCEFFITTINITALNLFLDPSRFFIPSILAFLLLCVVLFIYLLLLSSLLYLLLLISRSPRSCGLDFDSASTSSLFLARLLFVYFLLHQ